jgi:hypothetical protein
LRDLASPAAATTATTTAALAAPTTSFRAATASFPAAATADPSAVASGTVSGAGEVVDRSVGKVRAVVGDENLHGVPPDPERRRNGAVVATPSDSATRMPPVK